MAVQLQARARRDYPRRAATTVTIAATKRWLIRVHRWLGVGMWLVFCSWFASGIVMMYATYPELSSSQELALLPRLDLTRCCVTIDSAARVAGMSRGLREVRVEMLLDRPVYRLRDESGRRALVYADVGTPSGGVSRGFAAELAGRATGVAVDASAGTVLADADQWVLEVPASEYPLMRFAARDPAAMRVYVSLASGEVVQMVDRRQRALAWIGAIPHWIYPASLRRHRDGWRYLVLTLAALGVVGCVSGLTIGLWRARRSSRGPWVRSPFADPWMRWHHYLGLVFGAFAFTWVFSGLLSLDPFDWSPGGAASQEEANALAGGAIDAGVVRVGARDAWMQLSPTMEAHRLELTRVGGKTYYVATMRPWLTRLMAADEPGGAQSEGFTDDALIAAARRLAGASRIVSIDELAAYDDYYYARTADRGLPVLRVVLGDADATSYYLDPRSGTIALKTTRRSRVERWLYHGLHSLDFSVLMRHRRLWDVVVVVLSLGGVALSVTGTVLALRWVGTALTKT